MWGDPDYLTIQDFDNALSGSLRVPMPAMARDFSFQDKSGRNSRDSEDKKEAQKL